MKDTPVTRNGVYKDLSISPYRYTTPYGDCFKFPSKKKLDIYTREIEKELERLERAMQRIDLVEMLPAEIVRLIWRTAHRALYRKVVR